MLLMCYLFLVRKVRKVRKVRRVRRVNVWSLRFSDSEFETINC